MSTDINAIGQQVAALLKEAKADNTTALAKANVVLAERHEKIKPLLEQVWAALDAKQTVNGSRTKGAWAKSIGYTTRALQHIVYGRPEKKPPKKRDANTCSHGFIAEAKAKLADIRRTMDGPPAEGETIRERDDRLDSFLNVAVNEAVGELLALIAPAGYEVRHGDRAWYFSRAKSPAQKANETRKRRKEQAEQAAAPAKKCRCPECEQSMEWDSVTVPEHTNAEGNRCDGSGRKMRRSRKTASKAPKVKKLIHETRLSIDSAMGGSLYWLDEVPQCGAKPYLEKFDAAALEHPEWRGDVARKARRRIEVMVENDERAANTPVLGECEHCCNGTPATEIVNANEYSEGDKVCAKCADESRKHDREWLIRQMSVPKVCGKFWSWERLPENQEAADLSAATRAAPRASCPTSSTTSRC